MRPQTTCKRADCLLIVGPLLMIATTDSESLSPGSNPGPAAIEELPRLQAHDGPGPLAHGSDELWGRFHLHVRPALSVGAPLKQAALGCSTVVFEGTLRALLSAPGSFAGEIACAGPCDSVSPSTAAHEDIPTRIAPMLARDRRMVASVAGEQ